jgi:hypothetical protein
MIVQTAATLPRSPISTFTAFGCHNRSASDLQHAADSATLEESCDTSVFVLPKPVSVTGNMHQLER